jgi:quinoprotein glucose dehydrogenase
MKSFFLISALLCFLSLCMVTCTSDNDAKLGSSEWKEYLGGPERSHYSPLKQIDSTNVSQLQVAWTYRTGDSGQMQCNPIIVDGVLYGMTASTQPFALEAATGKELWRRKAEGPVMYNTSRGVTYWQKGEDKRILFTNGPWLYALNAKTGEAISSFGENGKVSLKAGLGKNAENRWVVSNTPGTVYEDMIIMPLRVEKKNDPAVGNIQAFNIRTGKLAWVFHVIPHAGEYGYDTWQNKEAYKNSNIGGANNWAGMAIDRKRGIVYVPTGAASDDFDGSTNKGSNLFSSTLLALDAKNGKRKWHYQFVHHDAFDKDAPAPPNLITVTRNGKKVDAVAQVTKQGVVFVFERETGKPLFPIEERKMPQSDVPGEQAWATQPFPVKPAPFARQTLAENEINPTAENRQELIEVFQTANYQGSFTPFSQKATIVFPGFDGGAEWGGAAADPDGILYVNSSEMAWLIALGQKPVNPDADVHASGGQAIYAINCAPCHGPERKGNPASGIASLTDIQNRRTIEQITNIISNGKGMMPAFTKLSSTQKQSIVSFLFNEKGAKTAHGEREVGVTDQNSKSKAMTYYISKFTKFLDKNGLPAITPPWGTLNAIDLNTGEYLWKIPFGEYPELMAKGIPTTGAESYGGPVVTASGLLFIAGTKDKKFRVYNKRNGQLLWETTLPAAGFATPSTYEVNGRQYVVIACGGNKLGAPAGDSYVAFALPKEVVKKEAIKLS